MVNTDELKIAMIRSKKSIADMSEYLGIAELTAKNKIHGKSDFKASEIQKLMPYLGIGQDEAFTIFFANTV